MKKLLVTGALAFAASFAFAQGYGRGYGPGMMGEGYGYGPGPGGGMFARLNLTEEQQDKIFAIQEQYHSKNFGTMSQMRSESYKLRRMLNAEGPDTKALVEQQKKVDELRRQIFASRLDMRREVEKVLTPEQRKQLRQFGAQSGPWQVE